MKAEMPIDPTGCPLSVLKVLFIFLVLWGGFA